MLRLLRYLIVLALVVWGAVWLADHPGSVDVTWLSWRISTSVPVLLFALLGAALLAFLLIRLIAAIRRWPTDFFERRRLSRREKGFRALSDGLAAVAGGQVRQARKLADKAEKLIGDPKLTRFLSAQTAQLTGDHTGLKAHYEAMRDHSETALLGWKGLLDLALAEDDWEGAIAAAREARRLGPGDFALADTLFALLIRDGQLEAAQDLAADAGRRKAFDRDQSSRRRALVLNERARQAEQGGDVKEALTFAKQASVADLTLADAALRLARLQAAHKLVRQAAGTLEKAWRAEQHLSIAQAYLALYAGEAPLQRLRRLDRLVQDHPDLWETHLALGEAALDAKLWGQARQHLSAALSRPTAALLGLLARLETGEYKNQKAAQIWLSRAPSPDPHWSCSSCGGTTRDWSLACPRCGSIDSLSWQLPAEAEKESA